MLDFGYYEGKINIIVYQTIATEDMTMTTIWTTLTDWTFAIGEHTPGLSRFVAWRLFWVNVQHKCYLRMNRPYFDGTRWTD